MKITAFILLIFCVQVSATTLAQNVTLSERNAPLEKVLNDIRRQSGYAFFYNQEWMQQAQPVDIEVKNTPLTEALKACFNNQPFDYAIVNKTIVLKLKEKKVTNNEPATPPIIITGRVTDTVGTPLIGATITNGTSKAITLTDEKGEFSTQSNIGEVLTISFIGYKPISITISALTTNINIQLHASVSGLKEVVVNTGYQTISQERAAGAYGYVDKDLLMRKVGTNVLDKLDGITTGVSILGIPAKANTIGINPINRNLNLTVRGVSTLSSNVGTDPLIVLDNFPYNGDVANINPNDIESVTILKDATSASIWGAKAGNGVIVLTSKKGRFNSSTVVDFNSNVTIGEKPNIYKDYRYLNSNDFINLEQQLFSLGYFNSAISNKTSYPALSPVIDILARQRAGTLNAIDATAQINALRGNDVRGDFYNYTMQKSINQQYHIGLRGGSNNVSYNFSSGYDDNRAIYVRNGSNRLTISAGSIYQPYKNLEITARIDYAHSQLQNNNINSFPGASSGAEYGSLYPYARLVDGSGNSLPVVHAYAKAYTDSLQKLGFLSYGYNPIDEINNADYSTISKDYRASFGIRYKLSSWINADIQYVNDILNIQSVNYQSLNTYYTRSLINQFTIFNPTTKKLTYQLPKGGINNLINDDLTSYNWRGKINVLKSFDSNNVLTGFIGAEINQQKNTSFTRLSYGYNPEFGTSTNNLNYLDALPVNPGGTSRIQYPFGDLSGYTIRSLSYFANAGYTFKDRYTFTVSGRKDGANIFGVKTNDRITPLWSIGGVWVIDKESFYKSDIFSDLRLRGSYGINGNVYNGNAYVTGLYGTSSLSGTPIINAISAPNPNLHWEKVQKIDIGIDFATKNQKLVGTIDFYKNRGSDLIEPVALPPSTGFSSFNGNAAATKTIGTEVSLTAKVLDRGIKWNIIINQNLLKDEVLKYDAPITSGSAFQSGVSPTAINGRAIYGIYAYGWAGLDSKTGDPQGFLKGAVSKDYSGIIANYQPDSLKYFGSSRPTNWGTLRNEFFYKGFSLSIMVTYKFGYYFRKPSVSGNLTDALLKVNSDYVKRWQKPGDESITNIPSFVYPSNNNRSTFYQYSAINVEKADQIRLQDIRLGYDLNKLLIRSPFSRIQIYTYASNLGLLWTANKGGYDPDNNNYYSVPFQIAFGLQATLK